MILLALVGYLAVQLGIGLWTSRRVHSEADYLVAGRRLGPVIATVSIYATWFGAETVVGSGGRAYEEGVSFASAEPFGYGLCLVIMGLVFAVPLWRRGLTTLADLFRQRFDGRVERLAAVVLIPSSILWAAAQMRAFGHVLTTTSDGLDLELAIALAAGFTVLYTMVGGMLADATNDLVQGTVLAAGLVILLIVLVSHLGGPVATADAMLASGQLMRPSGQSPLALLERWAIPIGGSVLATELVSRVIAARSPAVARGASLAGGALYIMLGCIPLVVGLAAARVIAPVSDAESVVPAVAAALLPPALFVLFAGALIAAILSTVDSTLLVAAGLLSHNLVLPLLGATREVWKVRLARSGVLVFGLVAYILASGADGVFDLVEQASALGGAPVLVTVSFGLFTRFGGARAAMATLVAGTAAYLAGSFGDFAYPFLASLGVSLATYAMVGALDRPALTLDSDPRL